MTTLSPRHEGGEVVFAEVVTSPIPSSARARNIIILLSVSVALVMTGFGIIWPVFARRLEETGQGVQTLSMMTLAFAGAQFAVSPFVGSLGDRFGRKPLVLSALGGYALVNVAFIFAEGPWMLISLRAVEGAVTAGLFPASMAVVADIIPPIKRARWTGIVGASFGAGFIFGPVIGGLIYDSFGYESVFGLSAAVAALGLLFTFVMLPETRTLSARRRAQLLAVGQKGIGPIMASIPRPLHIFAAMLAVDFIAVFVFLFIEPRLVFYLYDDLHWSTTAFGIVIGAYGLASFFGQFGLGRLSDRFGRRPVIFSGFIVMCVLYFGLLGATQLWIVAALAFVAGIGDALILPALAALYIDMTDPAHQARIMGVRGSAASLGGVAAPTLLAVVAPYTSPQLVFAISGVLCVIASVVVVAIFREVRKTVTVGDNQSGGSQRQVAAAVALKAVVTSALRTKQSTQSTDARPIDRASR